MALAHGFRARGPYLQQAAENAAQRRAPHEVIELPTAGLALLDTFPETPARAPQELVLQIALGPAPRATKGSAAPEVERTCARARALCTQVGETPQLFATLLGLCRFYRNRGAVRTAREIGEQLFGLAQREADPTHLLPKLKAHAPTLGGTETVGSGLAGTAVAQ